MPAPNDEDFVEKIAIMIAEANNGGTWAEHYVEDQKNVWRGRARSIIAAVREHDRTAATKKE